MIYQRYVQKLVLIFSKIFFIYESTHDVHLFKHKYKRIVLELYIDPSCLL